MRTAATQVPSHRCSRSPPPHDPPTSGLLSRSRPLSAARTPLSVRLTGRDREYHGPGTHEAEATRVLSRYSDEHAEASSTAHEPPDGAKETEVGGDVPDPTQGATGSTEVRNKHRATAGSENRDDRWKGPAMKTGEAQKAFVHRALPTRGLPLRVGQPESMLEVKMTSSG